MEKVTFITEDNITITGNYWDGGENTILLLHMMPAVKESWNTFADILHKQGWSVLAIDERGHGESTKSGTLDYAKFSDTEQQQKILDVRAAHNWLVSNNRNLTAIVGASIGANLALQHQIEKGILQTILLSAGFDYKGIETKSLVQKLANPQRVFFAGAKLDKLSGNYTCAEVAEKLFEIAPISEKESFVSETEAHGTNLFDVEPTLIPRLVNWLKNS
jgi:alpha-beta hydrolase superfamily lysophospholipase